MNKFQNYFYFLLVILSTSCSESTNQKKEVQDNPHHIEITSKNPKAIEFYRQAKLYEFNQEYLEARESYRSALRLDPNMVMALIGIK